jgi:hypothetical protein
MGDTTWSAEATRRRDPAAEGTHAEAHYYIKQVENRRPLVVRLRDGEDLRGVLQWYDRGCLRLGLVDGSHRIVPKRAIAYLWHESE